MNATTVAVSEAEVPTRAQRRHPKTFTEMLVSSVIGLIASLVLSIDAIALAKDPAADLSVFSRLWPSRPPRPMTQVSPGSGPVEVTACRARPDPAADPEGRPRGRQR